MLKVTCALIIKNGKLLVTQNGPDSDHPYKWEFPGGKLQKGEIPAECVAREIREELTIKIKILKKLDAVKWDYGLKKIELMPFLCTINSGVIKLTEHHKFQWINYVELFKLNFPEADNALINLPENKKILEKYLGENMYDS